MDGHALLIDCHTLEVDPVGVPDDVEVRVIHSGQERELASSAYAERIASVRAAEEVVGPLRLISDVGDLGPLASMADGLLTRRARHVVTECARVTRLAAALEADARVRRAVEALRAGDLAEMGRAMIDSHRSLREDFEVSTPVLDALVDRLTATPGVYGARLTGAGFGGCVVALAEPGALRDGWAVRASAGARIVA